MMEDREQRLADALAGFLDREEPIGVEEYCRQHPDLAADLRGQLETVVEIDQLAGEPSAEIPPQLSGYRIAGLIGAGGMGCVYLALDQRLGRRLAIKTLAPRWAGVPELRMRFMREAQAMARAVHPNIARIYSLGPDGEPAHFVMEYVDGAPLTEAARPLTFSQKAGLMRRVALAVDWLHRRGILHRDLKPANVLVTPELEPKLLDFGLALGGAERLTRPGDVVGTPEYLSPEQAAGAVELDARSDVFSLGAILYEVLTGALPAPDPVLPRRVNREVPGPLQDICLKALEREPAARYASAAEMAADLERFLAGEPVVAAPRSYARATAARVEQHLAELAGWRQDRIISESEFDALRKAYDRLAERDDAWIMEARRLSLPQVSLYLGAWVLAAGAALFVLFRYPGLSGTPAVLIAALAAAPAAWMGLRSWRADARRVGVAYLLAFCLLLPSTLLIAMGEYGLAAAPVIGKRELFSKLPDFKPSSNAQLWWALLLALPAVAWLRRFTGAAVFSLVVAFFGALLCLATLLRLGWLEWIDTHPGRPWFLMLPCAVLFLAAGQVLERSGRPADSRYFYPIGVVFTFAALTGIVVKHEPYARWLSSAAPWTRGQLEYLFLANAALYFGLQLLSERVGSPQMRVVARAFRFVIPGHVMTSLLLLGISASELLKKDPGMRFEARAFEALLPPVACVFVFGSIPKQMKNFFASGLVFLAIGVVRLQQGLFEDRVAWPVALLAAGTALMLVAARYAPLRLALSRLKKSWRG